MAQLISQFASSRSDFVSPLHPTPLPVGKPVNGQQDEVVLTRDTLVNFAQLAVRTCQRAQGDKNKAVREAWVRLCGTYQSKGGPLAAREVRKVGGCLLIGGFISSDDTHVGDLRFRLSSLAPQWASRPSGDPGCNVLVCRCCNSF